ncbi:hypothetical protein BC833DRAFT_617219 [Globomyces pollinis-pini]|nr:hypothetical protein BC833DRAFT_617219 [Globomyces pollinis-pini]
MSYQRFIGELKKFAYTGAAAPKLYNYHTKVASPFDPRPILDSNPFLKPVEVASNRFSSTANGIPVPNVLKRHIENPTVSLLTETSLGKISGFRYEIKGRTGSRSSRKSYRYGSLNCSNTSRFTGSMVDFGRSSFVTKRGSTGVKVWIAYGTRQ